MLTQSRVYVVIAILWCASLAAVGVAAKGQAQVQMFRPVAEPKVMSGPDVGFRVEGMYGDVPAGVVVVRVNGKWVEVRFAPRQPQPF
jgi:hypothetical protein